MTWLRLPRRKALVTLTPRTSASEFAVGGTLVIAESAMQFPSSYGRLLRDEHQGHRQVDVRIATGAIVPIFEVIKLPFLRLIGFVRVQARVSFYYYVIMCFGFEANCDVGLSLLTAAFPPLPTLSGKKVVTKRTANCNGGRTFFCEVN